MVTRAAAAYAATYFSCCVHKALVAYYLLCYAAVGGDRPGLIARAILHDLSKYRPDEASAFVRHRLLAAGTPETATEYQRMLAAFERQVELHYARNRHHPEHHPGGYAGMAELDRVEMVADWAASSRRRSGADLMRWIQVNAERYGYSEHDAAWMREAAGRMRAT